MKADFPQKYKLSKLVFTISDKESFSHNVHFIWSLNGLLYVKDCDTATFNFSELHAIKECPRIAQKKVWYGHTMY